LLLALAAPALAEEPSRLTTGAVLAPILVPPGWVAEHGDSWTRDRAAYAASCQTGEVTNELQYLAKLVDRDQDLRDTARAQLLHAVVEGNSSAKRHTDIAVDALTPLDNDITAIDRLLVKLIALPACGDATPAAETAAAVPATPNAPPLPAPEAAPSPVAPAAEPPPAQATAQATAIPTAPPVEPEAAPSSASAAPAAATPYELGTAFHIRALGARQPTPAAPTPTPTSPPQQATAPQQPAPTPTAPQQPVPTPEPLQQQAAAPAAPATPEPQQQAAVSAAPAATPAPPQQPAPTPEPQQQAAVSAAPAATPAPTPEPPQQQAAAPATAISVPTAPAGEKPAAPRDGNLFVVRFDSKLPGLTPSGIRALDAALRASDAGRDVQIAIEGCQDPNSVPEGTDCAELTRRLKRILTESGVDHPADLIAKPR
jgi:hypothetical protein